MLRQSAVTVHPHQAPAPARRHGAASGRWKTLGAVAAVIVFLAAGSSAQAQLFADNEARKALLDLRNKVEELDRKLEQQRSELSGRVSQIEPAQRGQLELANQLEQLSAQLAKLRGQMDQLSHQLAVEQSRTRDLYTDLDSRLKKLEPKDITLDGQTASVAPQEQAAYDDALILLRNRDYAAAIASLESLLSRFPRSAYRPSAQYWLGIAHYQLKDYKAALAAQRRLVTEHPDSAKVPDALLNIAANQIELKDTAGAKSTLQKILKDHPESEAAKAASARLKALK